MTSQINTTKSGVPTVTLKHGKDSITLPVNELTELITEALAARKAAYDTVRQAKATERQAKKDAAAAKKAERAQAQATKKEQRAAKLREQLAKLEA